jgi:hypothetical protein
MMSETLTKEDIMNIRKWITATTMMIEAKLRTPYSDSEFETIDKLHRLEYRYEREMEE